MSNKLYAFPPLSSSDFVDSHLLLYGNSLNHDNSPLWCGSDGPKEWERNSKDPEFAKLWAGTHIEYTFNSNGYRCPEWGQVDWENSILLFGDSNIAGIGNPKRYTVSNFLSKYLNRPVINLGVGGCSNMFIMYNNAKIMEMGITPFAIVNVWTDPARILRFTSPRHAETGYNHTGTWNNDMSYHKFWLRDDLNAITHYRLIKKVSRELCSTTKYIDFTTFNESASEDLPDNCLPFLGDWARDRMHSSRTTHKYWAKKIAGEFEKNDWLD